MLIKLPLDIWRDAFDWLLEKESKKRRKKRKKDGKGSIRKQLADKFNQLGDREFSELCQRWLHEWTKNVSIGQLSIFRDYNSNACYLRKLCDYLRDFTDNHLPFAESELPANIQCFKEIRIGCMPDATALQFIRRMQPLFRNVHLQLDPFNYTQNTLQTTLTTLDLMLPLIDGIETVYINDSRFLLNLRDIFPGQFFGVKMLQVERTEVVFTGEMADLLLQWLYATRADGEPRKLILADYPENGSELRERIRQDFLNANCRVAFFICFYTYESKMENVQESITTNAGTNEQLVIRNSDYYYHLYIGRCPAELDGRAWTEEMRSKPFDEEKSIISITFQDTEAAAGEVPGP